MVVWTELSPPGKPLPDYSYRAAREVLALPLPHRDVAGCSVLPNVLRGELFPLPENASVFRVGYDPGRLFLSLDASARKAADGLKPSIVTTGISRLSSR